MRLTSIKLSGFKSFAEPTTFQLPGQLVGVVGPNGCGKSNIMDAVRWVLGESRAGELRGGSMADVIFNGTRTRKPAGRASVELVFDNQDGRAGGAWSRYAEIAVKRVLARSGGSSYFINNQAVRRRDVYDVFLGTGLGPRAYAIIGQGTISRIIESRPEELRAFLEEAAGVSKYKERRRETENRLASARDNLARVGDLVRELDAGVRKLQRQAEAATRFQRLRAERDGQQNRLWFGAFAESEAEAARLQAQVAADAAVLAEQGAARDHAQEQVEHLRTAQERAAQELSTAQAHLYEAAAERARQEAQLRFAQERRTRAEAQLAQVATQRTHWEQQAAQGQQALADLQVSDAAVQTSLQTLQEALQVDDQTLMRCRGALAQGQGAQRDARGAVAKLRERASGQAAERRALERQRQRLQARQEQMGREREALPVADVGKLATLQQALVGAQAAETQTEQEARAQDAVGVAAQEALRACQSTFAEAARAADATRVRLQALQDLQRRLQAADGLAAWRAGHGLADTPELWRALAVEPGWEPALEAVLRERAQAQPAPAAPVVAEWLNKAPPVTASFYREQPVAVAANPHAAAADRPWPRLRDRVRTADPVIAAALDAWCAGCFTAPSWAEALALQDALRDDEEIFVTAGHSVRRLDVRFYAPPAQRSGFLVRARELAELQAQQQSHDAARATAREALAAAESTYQDAAAAQRSAQEAATRAREERRRAEIACLNAQRDADLAQERRARLARDLEGIAAEHGDLQKRQRALNQEAEALQAETDQAAAAEARATQAVQESERALDAARATAGVHRREQQEQQYAQRSNATRRADLQRALQTAARQLEALDAEQARCTAELQANTGDATQAELERARAAEAACTATLTQARAVADDLAHQWRATDEERLRLDRALEPLRERLAGARLTAQAAELRQGDFAAKLQQAGADLEALRAQGTGDADALQRDLQRLDAAIAACGAVNLAALEELGTARTRQTELQAQSDDLVEAVATLEQAIRTIDRESRALLTQTFTDVNTHFGRMFPELFGGGQAELRMTEGEVLESGVQVMAQPPGKKNQSIHLLSGGEKALTAIALVFAIFELNPAPFCLLDEVDAPLDDANTARYAALVRGMSRRGIQFLFISHNRIAMEYAEQLIGVTMAEEGVSRIVAVDLERALEYARAESEDKKVHASS